MKLNARHKAGLQLARLLPASWRWKLLKIPAARVLARDCGTAITGHKEDLSLAIPSRIGPHGEQIGSDVFAFRDAYSTHWGAHLTSDGRLISDLSRQGIGIDKAHFAFGKPRLKKSRRIRGSVAALTIEHRSNYFHFISDSISRLQLIQNLRHPPDYIYIQSNQPYQSQLLSLLGYKPEQIIDSSRHPFIQADELIVPSFTSNFALLTPNSISFLRSKLGKKKPDTSSSPGKVVYISRRDSPRRKVLNEDILLERLSSFQVQAVALSELSVEQQIELFEDAEVVILLTGAGLANLSFAPPNLFLILLTPPNWFGESALEVIKPFSLDFLQVVLSDYPADTDPYSQPVRLTEHEIDTIVQAVTKAKARQSPPEPAPTSSCRNT